MHGFCRDSFAKKKWPLRPLSGRLIYTVVPGQVPTPGAHTQSSQRACTYRRARPVTSLFSPARAIAALIWLAFALLAINPLAFAQRPDIGGMQMPSSVGTGSAASALRAI